MAVKSDAPATSDRAAQRLINLAWGLTAAVVGLAIFVWGYSLDWRFGHLTLYQLFPLLGLLAFSIMWAHYVVAAVRLRLGLDRSITRPFFNITSWLVLGLIILHPSLLSYQLFRDGQGLPPGSYRRVYGAATMLGSFSLLVFLAYEFRRRWSDRPWWWIVGYLSDIAMAAIIIHALKLGTQVSIGWYRRVWYFYGLTYGLALTYLYWQRFKNARLARAKYP